jgi:drug/metabolite transporter (DMT)-like permease
MLLGSVAFALMGTLAHQVGSRCGWQIAALSRTGLVLVFAILCARAAGAKLVFPGPRILWLRSVAGSVSLVCTFYALTWLPVSDVFTLTNTFPIWVAVLSWPLLRERPPGGVWLAILSGVAGVALIQRPHLAAGNPAVFVALFAAVATAVAMLGLNQLRDLDPWAIVVHFSAIGLVFVIGTLVVSRESVPPLSELGGQTVLMLVGVAAAATVGQWFLTKAFAAGSASKVSVVGLTQIVFALTLDVLWLHHPFDGTALLGMGLVMAPTAWLMANRA